MDKLGETFQKIKAGLDSAKLREEEFYMRRKSTKMVEQLLELKK